MSAASYSRAQKALHWAIALLVGLQYLAFDEIGRAFGMGMRSGEFTVTGGVRAHVVTGIAILVLMLWRIGLRLTRGAPPPPADEPPLAQRAAVAVHWAFYGLLVALPVSGLLAWFLPSGPLGGLHDLGRMLLMWLVLLHVGAVLVHQIWWRTGLIRRMT
ncbi:cytochrome b/b6 domain-containing protein [Amaricoccus sp.]|uniref:cytochrome b n=1 Tax=Amaricoccus sp. TaxID=1872485 RepID=UPI0026111D39|nr:cytochrome b/b6 domain-containing protein [Amaricoccus sp.]HRO10698.1 cytochrome b/b6 domain-containing protein [Amaricoccus sp.]